MKTKRVVHLVFSCRNVLIQSLILMFFLLTASACSQNESSDSTGDTTDAIIRITDTLDDITQMTDSQTPSADETSDSEEPPGWLSPVEGETNLAIATNGWYRGDLHYHTNYSDDALEQGGDDLKICLDIADAYRHEAFLNAFPDLAGNGLDYIAITDHRTDAALFDPDFKHDHLIVVPGEEYGGSGHANIFGISAHIPHDPLGEESQNQRHQDAIEEAHAMGAVFSINHPLDENNWVWDTPKVDAIEVVNGPWAAFYLGTSEEELNNDIAGGVENPFIRDAMENGGPAYNEMGLRFWQNHLTAGLHVAPVGGSDRHMLVPAALPTTYIHPPEVWQKTGDDPQDLPFEGIVAGIDQGHTFISRSPFGAQVLLEAESPTGERYPMGAALPDHGPFTIHVQITRAHGGKLRLFEGPLRPMVDGVISAQPTLLEEVNISAPRVEGSFLWTPPSEGGWLHAIVLEPLNAESWSEELAEIAEALSTPTETSGLLAMVNALIPLLDPNLLFNPGICDPLQWEPLKPLCMPVDQKPLATFYLPDAMVRILNRWFEEGEGTDFCFGALSSAFMVSPEND